MNVVVPGVDVQYLNDDEQGLIGDAVANGPVVPYA